MRLTRQIVIQLLIFSMLAVVALGIMVISYMRLPALMGVGQYRVTLELPEAGDWHELLNSDAPIYGGSGVGNLGRVQATPHPVGGWPASALVAVPPLGTVFLSNDPIPTTEPEGVHHARQ